MKNIFYLVLMGLLMASCQEVYEPDNLDTSTQIPVIQGSISNGGEPCSVKISYAQAFGSSQVTLVAGAKVFIIDNFGNQTALAKNSVGIYVVDTITFKPVSGRTYIVSAVLPNGDSFISDSVRMPMPFSYDSIYGNPTVNKVIVTDVDGNPSMVQYPALELLSAVSSMDNNNIYSRFEVYAISQKMSSRLPSPSNPMGYTIYDWTPSNSLSSNANQEAGLSVGGKYVIKNKHVAYLNYLKTTATDTTTAISPYGWIVTSKVFRISAQAYTYYQNVEKQLAASNHFFDPVPSQIKGNFKCVNKPDKLVLGLLEVSTQSKRVTGFYWSGSGSTYIHKELHNFVDTIDYGRQLYNAPGFWVNF